MPSTLQKETVRAAIRKLKIAKKFGKQEITEIINSGVLKENLLTYLNEKYGDHIQVDRGIEEGNIGGVPMSEFAHAADNTQFTTSYDSFTYRSTESLDELKNPEAMMKSLKTYFDATFIGISKKEEEKTIKTFSKYFKVNNDRDVINFLNQTSINPSTLKQETQKQNAIRTFGFQEAMDTAVEILTNENVRFDSLKINKDDSDINKKAKALLSLLEENTLHAGPLILFLEALSNASSNQALTNKSKEVSKGSMKAATTLLEYVALANLTVGMKDFLRVSDKDKTQTQITVEAKGSVFQESVDRLNHFTGPISELRKEIRKEATKLTDKDTLSMFTSFGKWSGILSKEQTKEWELKGKEEHKITVADLLMQFPNNHKVYIDAKMGQGQGANSTSRYTPSGGVKTNLYDIRKNNTVLLEHNDFFNNNLNILINFMFYMSRQGKFDESNAIVSTSKILRKMMAYAVMGSKAFEEHYRIFNEDGTIEAQPSFLLTRAGYIWYSDFFSVMSEVMLSNLNKGTGASIRIKKPKDLNITKLENFQTALLNVGAEKEFIQEYQQFVKSFLSETGLELKIDIDDVYKKAQPYFKARAKGK